MKYKYRVKAGRINYRTGRVIKNYINRTFFDRDEAREVYNSMWDNYNSDPKFFCNLTKEIHHEKSKITAAESAAESSK